MQGEQPTGNTLQVGYTYDSARHSELTHSIKQRLLLPTWLHHCRGRMEAGSGEGVSRPPIEDSNVSTTAMAVRALTSLSFARTGKAVS